MAPPAKKTKESTVMSMVVDKEGKSNQEGKAPPEKKSKESTTISLVVEEWKEDQTEQFSAVHRIKGYPWRLRFYRTYQPRLFRGRIGSISTRSVELICDKSNEAELWTCNATLTPSFTIYDTARMSINSWDKNNVVSLYLDHKLIKLQAVGAVLKVNIELDNDGEKWRPRPILDPLEPLDGILVIGDMKINVHKASLASQSSFFDRLFFGNFKEKNMSEITIGDVEYEEFNNLLKIIYRHDGAFLADKNVCKVLHLADRFELKIVEDVCINFLLSSSSSLTIHEKLLISEENNLPFLKEKIIERYNGISLRVLVDSPEWDLLSKETTKALMKRSCDLISSGDCADSSEPKKSEPDSSESESE